MQQITPQQLEAVKFRQASVVLASGAGCGKTHVLTERFLDHLRSDGVEVGQLLAITFTDRAARQMRQRIRQAILAEVRQADDAAAERWLCHLRALETAHISTIHAFCSSLLRQHAVEAGLDPAFEVLEEVLAVNLRQQTMTRCLQELLTAQTPPADDLRELIVLYGWDGTQRAVEQLMRNYQPLAWQAWLEIPAQQIAARWQGEERRPLLASHVDYLIRGVPKIARCLRLLATTPCHGPKMRSYIALIMRELPRLAEVDDLETAVSEILGVSTVRPELAKAWPSQEAYENIRDALAGFRDQLRDKMQLFIDEPEAVVDAVIVGQRLLRVADAAAQAYRHRKRRESAVDFDDLLTLARDLLRHHADVRTSLQERYRFVLIDELQDTDPIQHELIALLCGPGLVAGKLFAVGDHQQSIYRFRGAAVELFTQLRAAVPAAGQQALNVNFRSQPSILNFSNALFAHHLRYFQALQAFHPQLNAEPCIEFLWNQQPGETGQEPEPEHHEDDAEPAGGVAEARAREAEAIARRIRIMLDDGEPLVRDAGTLRAVRRGDLAILFRSMSSVGTYERALRQYGIDYYLVGGQAFFAQQEIYDLLHLLRALENPQDELSLAGTLRSPFCCLSDETLFWLSRHRHGLWSGLHDAAIRQHLPQEQQARAAAAERLLERWRSLKDQLPIARLIGQVFADSNYDAGMQFEFLADRKLANLWKLQELARTFDRSGRFGLAEFIARLDDLVSAQPREEQAATQPENADVVRIMSIHQAKGLEFPVVILPDLGHVGGDPRGQMALWHPALGCLASPPREDNQALFSRFGWELGKAEEAIAAWHEEMRTLYVACTRAEDYLILSASLPEPFQPENAWMLLLSERFDIMTGQCLDKSIAEERQPRVRVTRGQDLPKVKADERSAAGVTAALVDASGVEAVPQHSAAHDVITVAGLEEFLRCRQAGRLFDPVGLRRPEPMGKLQAVLQAWGFREVDGWRAWLDKSAELETVLMRFAGSELARQLAQARVVHQFLEYVVKWPAPSQPSLFARFELPPLWGVMDCVWQDESERWHLVGWGHEAARTPQQEQRRLLIAAHALRCHTGAWPASVALYRFSDGRLQRFSEKELNQARHWAEVSAALEEIREQRWSRSADSIPSK